MCPRPVRWLVLGGVVLLAGPVFAVEPYLEFVAGLRERGFYDTAEQYLLSLSDQPGVPQEIRDVVPYELGVTIRDSARSLLIAEEQRARFDIAQAAFERFVQGAPQHPLAGRANSERAKILVEKARVNLWEADGTTDATKATRLRSDARQLIQDARKIFETAVQQHKQSFEKFPGFIPPEERARIEQRDAAEAEYIQALIDTAESIYWEAQTYTRDEPQRLELLTTAMLEFEKIHTAYRSMIGGLLARVYQGKCLEEMGDIGAALGIYGELLKHGGESQSMMTLQALAQRFELMCYNHESKREYRLVNLKASEWLRNDKNRRAKYSETGRGIEWEQARALEALGQDRTVPENERTQFLNQAIGIARGLSRRAGPYKAPAAAMVARLSQLLGRDPNDPTDFSSAYGRADELFTQAKALTDKMAAAQAAGNQDELVQHAEARKGVAIEMGRMFELALQLADSTTDDVLQRRSELLLAVSYIYQERPYEAVAIADYFLRNHGDSAPEMLRFAGDVVLSAMTTAYERADEGDRDFERRYLLGITALLTTRWPETELATRAHISAGKLLRANKDHLAAAEEFLKVSASSPERGSAELMAGSAYLNHYEQQAMLEGPDAATPEDLIAWRDAAEQYLQSGVAAVAAQTPSQATNEDLIRGKVALAIVRNVKGIYTTQGGLAGAVELLTAEPHSVVKATEPPAGQARPTTGSSLQSTEFAGAVYRILLRAYIGAKNIDAARATMKALETLGGPGNSADLTHTFVEFGKQLQQELIQLEGSGEIQRLAEVRQGFETFLTDLYNRDESQQTFGSLNWIAETYVSLAEGSRDDLIKSTEYFEKAANAYAKIIARGSADAAFYGSPQNEIAVKVRMLEARLAQQDYEAAEATLFEVLKTAANAPNVQQTAARLYQQWGASGDSSKYQFAMHGRKEPGEVWGWGGLANRMHEQILRNPDRDDFRAIFFEAVYEHARTMKLAAANQTGEERSKLLRRAVVNLETVGRTTRNIPDDEYQKLNTLYRELLADVGEQVADLRRGGAAVARSDDTATAATGGGTVVPTVTAEEEVKTNPHQTRNMIVALVLLVVGGGAVYGIFRWTNAQANKRRAAKLAAIASTPAKPKRAKAPQP